MQIQSINQNYTNTKLNNKLPERAQKTTNCEVSELSGYQAGQAILARNNISFRNLSQPVEVTHLYNKKTEGKDHLDLPNIHVYEFSDTNLKVYVNSDKNINTDEKSVLNSPKIQVFVANVTHHNSDLLKEKLLFTILKNKFKTLSEDVNFNDSLNRIFSYDQFFSTEPVDNFAKYNDLIFNLKINNVDIQTAKNEICEQLNEVDIERDDKIKLLYGKEHFKTKQEVLSELEQITPANMNVYYSNYKDNISMRAFVTVSDKYFSENKDRLLTIINSNINCKLKSASDNKNLSSDFYPNKKLLIRENNADYESLNYPVKLATTRDDLLGDITAEILNNNNIFKPSYSIFSDYFELPFNFKEDIPRKEDNKYYSVKLRSNFDRNSLKMYQVCLKEVCNTSLQTELVNVKNYYKDRLKTTFTGDRLDIIKAQELVKYSDDIYSLYEIIDSITEEDIKNFIKTYFIEQQPIIEKMDERNENHCSK